MKVAHKRWKVIPRNGRGVNLRLENSLITNYSSRQTFYRETFEETFNPWNGGGKWLLKWKLSEKHPGRSIYGQAVVSVVNWKFSTFSQYTSIYMILLAIYSLRQKSTRFKCYKMLLKTSCWNFHLNGGDGIFAILFSPLLRYCARWRERNWIWDLIIKINYKNSTWFHIILIVYF